MKNDPRRKKIVREVTNEITKKLLDEGKIIEAGWYAYLITGIPDELTPMASDFRLAFLAGAQHLWGSIMVGLEEGREPTATDLKRMDLINAELQKAYVELQQQYEKKQAMKVNPSGSA